MKLPSGVPPEVPVPGSIKRSVRLFLDRFVDKRLCVPGAGRGQCLEQSEKFSKLVPGSKVASFVWRRLDEGTEALRHSVVLIAGVAVDWTANQFAAQGEEFPVPYIIDAKDVEAWAHWIDKEVHRGKYQEPETVESAKVLSADKVGKAVKKWCDSNESYKVLDTYVNADTWSAGGCVALAYALNSLLQGSKIVGIIRTFASDSQAIDHVAVEYQGRVIDADGAHKDRRHWLYNWMASEEMEGSELGPVIDVEDSASEEWPLPNDQNGAQEVAEALKPILGISSAQRKALLLEVAASRIERNRMGTFTKLLASVDRRQQSKPVELDLRQGGEIWHMTDEWEFITESKMTAQGVNDAQHSEADES